MNMRSTWALKSGLAGGVRKAVWFTMGCSSASYPTMLAVSLIGKKMAYRTLIQGRLAPFIGIPAAAVLLFGLLHFCGCHSRLNTTSQSATMVPPPSQINGGIR